MLNRHVKQAPSASVCRAIKPAPKANVGVALPARDTNNPYDLEPGFEFLRWLIEARVIEQLGQIFEQVCRLEALGTNANRRAVRLRGVLGMLGIGKSTLYARINPTSPSYDPTMPKPFKLGKGKNAERSASAWWDTEVIAYLESCAQTRH